MRTVFLTTLKAPHPLLMPLVIGLVACGDGAPGADSTPTAPTWEAELLHEIGSIDDPMETLTRVGEVVLTDDGLLLIGQGADRQIRVHDSDGTFLRMIGRRGEGPGELGSLGDFAVRGDTVTVVDGGNSRVTEFSLRGEPLGDRRFERVSVSSEGATSLYSPSASPLPDGSSVSQPAMIVAGRMGGGGGGGPSPERFLVVRRMALDGTLRDTILAAGISRHLEIPEGRSSIVAIAPMVAEDRTGDGALLVLRSPTGNPDPGTFRLVRVDAAGDTVFDRAFGFEALPLPADTVDRRAAAVPEDRRADYRDRIWAPDARPPVEALIATLSLPRGTRIAESRGDEVVVVRTDELDVEYVQRWRLGR